MARGPRKHLKRLSAPKHWMLSKMGGTFAPRPSSGPHRLRECLPLVIFLRNRLKYALTGAEAIKICNMRHIQVDGKVRTDPRFPAGFMDVITIPKTKESFRMLYDVKGRYCVHRIQPVEAKYKLCRVEKTWIGARGVPYLQTHDGRVLRFYDPDVKPHDTIKIDLENGMVDDHVMFEAGNVCMAIGGHNVGRIGTVLDREKHHGEHDLVHIKDAMDHTFTTRIENVFILGKGTDPWVSVPKQKGIRLTIAEERDRRREVKAALT
eukprot:TRINITY_DN6658_c0_g1_i2.p1 TRINITY_DN6658_c0_g1~~TRINITY_DN6658_c0_g1_i2.p1  ORF type:complete len:264 (+),score=-1.96 TRINITY_DN6658_c0_g1_i2:102-893(+)